MSASDVHGPKQNIFYAQIASCVPELLTIEILGFGFFFTSNFTDNFLKHLRRGHMQNTLYMLYILS